MYLNLKNINLFENLSRISIIFKRFLIALLQVSYNRLNKALRHLFTSIVQSFNHVDVLLRNTFSFFLFIAKEKTIL